MDKNKWIEETIKKFNKKHVGDMLDANEIYHGIEIISFLRQSLEEAWEKSKTDNCWKCKLWHEHGHITGESK